MEQNKKKKIIKIITFVIVGLIIALGIFFIVYGFIPKGGESGGICTGDHCEVPI